MPSGRASCSGSATCWAIDAAAKDANRYGLNGGFVEAVLDRFALHLDDLGDQPIERTVNIVCGISHATRGVEGTFGTGTTGSRIANGSFALHKELETEFARFLDRKHCIIFTTGYQANLGMMSGLAGPRDTIYLDADSHSSIYDGCTLSGAKLVRFRHNDAADLDKRLARGEQPLGLGIAGGVGQVVDHVLHDLLGRPLLLMVGRQTRRKGLAEFLEQAVRLAFEEGADSA